MLEDQYGMVNFLQILKSNDQLSLGQDLAKMGLDFGSKKYLHKTFWGPWNQQGVNVPPVDLGVEVPVEYRNIALLRNRLPDLKMANLQEDILFYLFYNCPGDVYQLAAASELIKRNWRFHKVCKFWLLTASPPNFTSMPNEDLGESICILFNPEQWRKETRTMHLKVDELETSLNFSRVFTNNMPKCDPSTSSSSSEILPTVAEKDESPKSPAKAQTPIVPEDPYASAISSTVEQLRKIAQGISLPRPEMRLLLNCLRENPEIMGRNEFRDLFMDFMQHEPEIAGVLLTFQLMYDPTAYITNLELLLNMELNVQMLVAVNKLVQLCEYKSLPIPEEFLNKFISLSISTCDRIDAMQDLTAHRLVRMVCVFLSSLLSLDQFNSMARKTEIQSFATMYLSLREASLLYQKALGNYNSPI